MSISNVELMRTLLPEEAQYLETRCQMTDVDIIFLQVVGGQMA